MADRNTQLLVTEKKAVAEGVVSLTLADPDGTRLPDWAPGAHLDLVLPAGVRQYSLCGDRWDAYRYRIGVLREPEGRGGSAFVHDELAVGDRVTVGGPRNNFRLAPSPRYLFIAGGIGITPLLPMIRQAALVDADWHLLYGGRSRASMGFLDELGSYGDRVALAPQDEVGLLDIHRALDRVQADTQVYVCGPGPLLDAVTGLCSEWAPGRLRTERFVAAELDAPVRDEPFEVELARSGISLTVQPQVSVLDAIHGAGVQLLSSCRTGTCGTCETGVLRGVPDHRDSILDDDERTAGDVMFVCVSRACGEGLVLDV